MAVRKLSRIRDGENVIIFQVAGFDPIRCDFSELSSGIQHKLIVHGGGAKVGDSAAGLEGQDAYNAIVTTWNNLKADKWTERVAGGGDRISITQIKESLSLLSEEERIEAIKIFAKLGKNVA